MAYPMPVGSLRASRINLPPGRTLEVRAAVDRYAGMSAKLPRYPGMLLARATSKLWSSIWERDSGVTLRIPMQGIPSQFNQRLKIEAVPNNRTRLSGCIIFGGNSHSANRLGRRGGPMYQFPSSVVEIQDTQIPRICNFQREKRGISRLPI